MKDYTGQRFEKLVAISFSHRTKSRHTVWLFKCDCGNNKKIRLDNVVRGRQKSCGCGCISGTIEDWKKDFILLAYPLCDSNQIAKHINVSSNSVLTYLKSKNRKLSKVIRPHKEYNGVSFDWFNRTRDSAKSRNKDFDLTIEQVYELYKQQNFKCALTGVHITLNNRRGSYGNPDQGSLDRIDSSIKRYSKDNVQLVTKQVNLAKLDYTQQEFIDMCKAVAEHCK